MNAGPTGWDGMLSFIALGPFNNIKWRKNIGACPNVTGNLNYVFLNIRKKKQLPFYKENNPEIKDASRAASQVEDSDMSDEDEADEEDEEISPIKPAKKKQKWAEEVGRWP